MTTIHSSIARHRTMDHFITIFDADAAQLQHILSVSRTLREQRQSGQANAPILAGRTLAMIFEKPSLRTRVSFEQAMFELGGNAIVLDNLSVGLGARESVADVTRVLTGMVQGIMARVFEHDKLTEMASYATIPVVNALSDYSHPCQALADIMTMQDEFGEDLSGRTLTFVGDGNNVARSLAMLCAAVGVRFILAAPQGYQLEDELFHLVRQTYPEAQLEQTDDVKAAVSAADAIYTDTWVSMGQETEKEKRVRDFAEFQVNDDLLAAAPDHAIVLHCLPAKRGYEITDSVMDGSQARVFPQAHNRLHAQKGLLAVLMGGV